MKAGMLRHSVLIEQVTESRGGMGEVTESWAQYCSRKAGLETLGGNEAFAGGMQEQAVLRHRIRMHYDSVTAGITPKMRAVLSGRIFDIEQAFSPNELQREIHLICREVV